MVIILTAQNYYAFEYIKYNFNNIKHHVDLLRML